jgi:hypothetical protein
VRFGLFHEEFEPSGACSKKLAGHQVSVSFRRKIGLEYGIDSVEAQWRRGLHTGEKIQPRRALALFLLP